MFHKKATKIDEIFTVDLMLCSKCQINGEDIVYFLEMCPIFSILLMDDLIKFIFSEKATKSYKIFTVDLTLCSKCQIDGEDFFNFCGFLRKDELYTCVQMFPFFSGSKISLAKQSNTNWIFSHFVSIDFYSKDEFTAKHVQRSFKANDLKTYCKTVHKSSNVHHKQQNTNGTIHLRRRQKISRFLPPPSPIDKFGQFLTPPP